MPAPGDPRGFDVRQPGLRDLEQELRHRLELASVEHLRKAVHDLQTYLSARELQVARTTVEAMLDRAALTLAVPNA